MITSFSDTSQLAILCYHHVDSPKANPYNVSSEQLRAQLTALKQAGCTFVSMASVRRFCFNGAKLPSGSVLVTFDDGNHDTYTTAWPILKALKVPMTVFVYPTAICVGHKRGFMDWTEVRAMSLAGVEIGAHGFDHPYLPYPPKNIKTDAQIESWLKQETLGAKTYIEKQISKNVTTLAFPFGLMDARSQAAIVRAGYQLAFNIKGINNTKKTPPLNLNRIMVVNSDTPTSIVRRALFPAPRVLGLD